VKIPELANEFYRIYQETPSSQLKVHSPIDMVKSLQASSPLSFLADDAFVLKTSNLDGRVFEIHQNFHTSLNINIKFAPIDQVAPPQLRVGIGVT
jgi:hypothetical protein